MSALLQVGFLDVNEGGDPKDLPPGTLVKADNCSMDKARRLMKRKGTTGLVKTALSGSNPAAGKRLLTTGPSLGITDGQTAWVYSDALAKWSPVDRIPSWRVTKRTLIDSTRSVLSADVAIYGSMLVTAYTCGASGLFAKIDNLATGAPILPATRISSSATARYPRVLISGTKAYVIYSQNAEVSAITINLSTFAVTDTALVSDSAAIAGPMDAVIGTPTAGVPTLYIGYELDAGTDRVKVASFTLSTLAAVATKVVAGVGLRCVSLAFGDLAQKVTMMFADTTSSATRAASFPTSLATVVGPTTVDAILSDYVFAAEDDATNVLLGWSRNDGNGTDADRLKTALYSVAAHVQVAASVRITFGLYNPTKPWRTASRWFVAAVTWVHVYSVTATDRITAPSSVVMEIETAASLTGATGSTHPHVATLENQTGWYITGLGQTKAAVDSSGIVWLAAPYRDREPDNYVSQIPIGWDVFRLEASGGDAYRPAVIGSAALCAGGAPVWFDGESTMPYGFAHAPQIISVTASGGGSVADGTYSYVATYAWRDASGLLHRSAPSPPKTGVTSGGNNTLVVKVATSSVSAKIRTLTTAQSANPVLIEIWRTDGVAGTGSHYRLTLEPTYQVLTSDALAKDVSLTDTKAASNIANGAPAVTLATQAQLYTDLGELANVPPPAFITTAIHKNRIVGIAGDLHTVWMSKDSTEDLTQAPGFNEALTLTFADEKTALASLNTTLVVFGEDGIDIVHGDGPDATGSGAWQTQRVQTDLGCTEPRSVVTTPMGVMFLSARGLELLDVGLNVVWIGERIKDTIATYPTITSATLVASEQEVRFTCTNGSTGIVLAYDYGYKVWFVRRYKDSADTSASNIAFVDAALIDGVYTMLTAGGQVYRETTAHKLDNGTDFVDMDVIMAPISAQPGRSGWSNANLGWTRMKDVTLMGTSVTNHNITVSTALDYANSYGYTKTFAAGGAVTATGPLEKCRVTPPVQKCQAIQIRIQDATPTDQSTYPITTGDGPILEALALRISPLTGPAKTAAGQQG